MNRYYRSGGKKRSDRGTLQEELEKIEELSTRESVLEFLATLSTRQAAEVARIEAEYPSRLRSMRQTAENIRKSCEEFKKQKSELLLKKTKIIEDPKSYESPWGLFKRMETRMTFAAHQALLTIDEQMLELEGKHPLRYQIYVIKKEYRKHPKQYYDAFPFYRSDYEKKLKALEVSAEAAEKQWCQVDIQEIKPKGDKGILPDLRRLEIAARKRLAIFDKQERERHRDHRLAALEARSRNVAATIRICLPADHNCPYCHGPLGEQAHADHIYPVKLGGLSSFNNMVMICPTCNIRKGAKTLREFIEKYSLDRSRIEAALNTLKKTF